MGVVYLWETLGISRLFASEDGLRRKPICNAEVSREASVVTFEPHRRSVDVANGKAIAYTIAMASTSTQLGKSKRLLKSLRLRIMSILWFRVVLKAVVNDKGFDLPKPKVRKIRLLRSSSHLRVLKASLSFLDLLSNYLFFLVLYL